MAQSDVCSLKSASHGTDDYELDVVDQRLAVDQVFVQLFALLDA